MKRRSILKPKRDRENEQLKSMTTVLLTESEVVDRWRADLSASQASLKTAFVARKDSMQDQLLVKARIKMLSARIRILKDLIAVS